MIGCFLVCAQWLSDGTCPAARYHHGRQTDHQQRAGDCYSVSTKHFINSLISAELLSNYALLYWRKGLSSNQRLSCANTCACAHFKLTIQIILCTVHGISQLENNSDATFTLHVMLTIQQVATVALQSE